MPRLTPAVVRSLDILELFIDAREGLSAPDVARRTGLPRTTVHEILTTLAARAYLKRDEATATYHLGLSVFRLGNAFAERLDLHAVGLGVARAVSEACDETVHVAILDGADVVYVCKVDSTQSVRMVSRAGGRVPAHCTAVGKALLAHLPPDELRRLLERELPGLTPNTITEPDALARQLAEIGTSGLAFEYGESNPHVSCVAAPVRDHTGTVVAALSISVPDMRWKQRPEEEWATLAADGARRLSTELGSV
ncbi:IclR family transcriptional regulator [Streptomyces sp. ISL-36]|uniref:IclR family transcriptional regulator n=1 Tax=Streptomyces sp. ISL-36 TaxID=2819182 RepID=UPI001BE4FAD6|nr:IclR family transcriptional regulator [Streptomyces sp. ISL-36]MBT2439478.1 IclR family transcriptional regulator [Streptomyces sp. ISL-36]